MIYLWLLIFSLAGPLSHSFDRRINFYRNFWALIPAITMTAAYFLLWDVLFTEWGVWGFNPNHLMGINIGNLPLEEVLFFWIVPFACMFLYEVMKYYVPRDIFAPKALTIVRVLAPILLLVGIVTWGRAYTSVTALGASALLFIQGWWLKGDYLGRFWMGYLVSLVPFFLVNGILTGSFLAEPVVWYNNAENLGVRMGTIPVEDSVYLLLLLLSTTTIFEEMKARTPSVLLKTPFMIS